MKKNIKTNSRRETQALGASFGALLLSASLPKRHALVVKLEGELGSGKTTFVQGVAKGLRIKEKILSPTFVIIKVYKLQTKNYKLLYHIDCYRIKDEHDLLALGWDKIVSDPRNLVFIEWLERVRKILPQNTISISFETIKSSKSPARKITFP